MLIFAASLLPLSIIAVHSKAPLIFFRFDGIYVRILATMQEAWSTLVVHEQSPAGNRRAGTAAAQLQAVLRLSKLAAEFRRAGLFVADRARGVTRVGAQRIPWCA